MNNLTVRTLSGIGFGAVTLACLLLNKYLFAAFIIFIMAMMMAEFYRMTMGEEYRLSRTLAIIAGEILFLLVFLLSAFHIPVSYLSVAIIPIFAVIVSSLYVKDKTQYSKFGFVYTGLMYIAVPLSLSNLIAFKDGDLNATLLLCFFVIIWCSDVGAYCFGTAFGQKHGKKLFPSISPKKSWIGFWGGLVCSIIGVTVLYFVGLLDFPLIHCIILGIIMHISGVFGDLSESQWKRMCGVKDSGDFIPGHGGMLDRFDSALVSMPMGAVYLSLLHLL